MRRLFLPIASLCACAAVGAPALAVSPAPDAQVRRERSANPPAWTKARPVCKRISLTDEYPFGVSGPLAGGYNATLLLVVKKAGMGCDRARTLARRDWVEGHKLPLRWTLRRYWRSTAGSAYVGDYRGRKGAQLVEYFAVH